MLSFINQFFGDKNLREIDRKYQPVVDKIHEATPAVKVLSDDNLRGRTTLYRERIRNAVGEIEARQQEIQEALRLGHAQGDSEEYLTLDDRQDYFEELDELEEEWLEVAEETLTDILPEAFAVVKEVCRRLTERGSLRVRATDHDRAIRARRAYPKIQGSYAIWPNQWEAGGAQIQWQMIPYDVQLLGGVVLHRGNIAEMKTGEGKTLVAVAPVYLNALLDRGVHLITVNPYLAQRDAEWMGPIFEFLGLTVDVIDGYDAHSNGRRNAYRALSLIHISEPTRPY